MSDSEFNTILFLNSLYVHSGHNLFLFLNYRIPLTFYNLHNSRHSLFRQEHSFLTVGSCQCVSFYLLQYLLYSCRHATNLNLGSCWTPEQRRLCCQFVLLGICFNFQSCDTETCRLLLGSRL